MIRTATATRCCNRSSSSTVPNDKYWPLDALNLYWSELEGEKYILYVPNQGHDIKDYDRVIGSLVALHRHVAHGAPLPKLQWQFVEGADDVRLELSPSMKPRQMLVWTARSDTQDFRDARWESVPMKRKHDQYVVTLDRPRSGYVAMLGEGKFTRKFKMPVLFLYDGKNLRPDSGPNGVVVDRPGAAGASVTESIAPTQLH